MGKTTASGETILQSLTPISLIHKTFLIPHTAAHTHCTAHARNCLCPAPGHILHHIFELHRAQHLRVPCKVQGAQPDILYHLCYPPWDVWRAPLCFELQAGPSSWPETQVSIKVRSLSGAPCRPWLLPEGEAKVIPSGKFCRSWSRCPMWREFPFGDTPLGQLALSGALPLLLVLWVEGDVTGPPWEAEQQVVVSRPGRGLTGTWAVLIFCVRR